MDKIAEILHYWFGEIAEDTLPTEHRTWVWFGGDPRVDEEIKQKFSADFTKALAGEYDEWKKTSRGSLALIIILDQFSRHIYRNHPLAFAQDQAAVNICLSGIEQKFDHTLSLMERAFFYLPLMHSENLDKQAISVHGYETLVGLSFPEVGSIFQKFLHYAIMHENIIVQFGRFPQRNELLARISTPEELEFLRTKSSLD